MRAIRKTAMAGVTLTELIVVLAIVSLLATLAVPVVINRSRQARFSVAQAEVEALAKGEEICGITHGFYVPLRLLDNIPYVQTGYDANTTDDIKKEIDSGFYPIFVDINTAQQMAAPGGQLPTTSAGLALLASRLESEWAGPFTQPQRVYDNLSGQTTTFQQLDHPLDPWGNAYRLYSPEGIVGSTDGAFPSTSPATSGSMNSTSFDDGQLTTTDDRFDRFAVVSFGPDGISDGPNQLVDDIIYFFGTLVRRTDSVP